MVFLEKSGVAFKTETLAYLQQLMNVKANLVVASNQLGCNADCYDKVRRNSCYDKASCNSCNDEAGNTSCYDKAGRNS